MALLNEPSNFTRVLEYTDPPRNSQTMRVEDNISVQSALLLDPFVRVRCRRISSSSPREEESDRPSLPAKYDALTMTSSFPLGICIVQNNIHRNNYLDNLLLWMPPNQFVR